MKLDFSKISETSDGGSDGSGGSSAKEKNWLESCAEKEQGFLK